MHWRALDRATKLGVRCPRRILGPFGRPAGSGGAASDRPQSSLASASRAAFRPSSCAPTTLSRVIRTQPRAGGWLEGVCGAMVSGKSEELIRRLRRAEIAGQRALIVKPLIDDRYDVGHVVSHAGAKMRAVTAESSDEVLRLAGTYDAVGIDEVQFFDLGIMDAIDELVEKGTRVVAAGLAQDFRGLPFGAMPTLLCVAEFVDKLEAVCHRCGGPATMTQRLVDGEPAPFGGETIQVGALDSYEARCRNCHAAGEDVLASATG